MEQSDNNNLLKKGILYLVIIILISALMVAIGILDDLLFENAQDLRTWALPLAAGVAIFAVGKLFYEKSREVEKLKYEFITVAAHKLRTPLTRIKWAAAALEENYLNENDKKQMIAEIKRSDSQLLSLTDELLIAAKTQSKKYPYKIEPADLGELTKEVINNYKQKAEEKNIKVTLKIEKSLPKINIDKEKISSVIQTLLENALFYTKDEIKIKIILKAEKNSVVFLMRDNGIGVNKKDQKYIFSKFYRSPQAYLTETEGMGIGLFLAESIINGHGGKIGVTSDGKNKGSEFWFKLKIK